MSRIPLVATVVGALLIGGATTGGTFASWSNQRQLHAHGVQSGQLSFTATSPGAVAVDQTAGYTADSTFVLDDTSVGKNNRQRITASVAGTPAGITARIGTSCASATTASVAVDTTPTSADQSLCVRVTVDMPTTAVSGNVTVTISGAQRPTGWSTPSTMLQVPVTVTPAVSTPVAPVISCGAFQSNGNYSFTWTALDGLTYSVHRSTGPNLDGSFATVTATGNSPYTASLANPSTTFWRVKATNAAGTSGWSNTLRLARDGNGINSIDCDAVTP